MIFRDDWSQELPEGAEVMLAAAAGRRLSLGCEFANDLTGVDGHAHAISHRQLPVHQDMTDA